MEKVGAPDPERRTSPILDDDAELSLDAELEAGMCYFNDAAYVGPVAKAQAKCSAVLTVACGSARER